MIRYFITLVAVLLSGHLAHAIIPITTPSARTGVDVSLWNFQTQQEMEVLIKRNYDDPRASYYLINNAYQKGYVTHAALLYIANARSKGDIEPNSWASAAYAAALGGGDFAYTLHTPDRDEFIKVQGYTGFLNGELDEVVKRAPKSPAVFLMAAVSTYSTIAGTSDSQGRSDLARWRQLFSWLKTARQLDPKWADSQYWHGVALDQYWEDSGKNDNSLLPRAKSALLKAQSLDPNITGSCAWILWLVARDRNLVKEQLTYMDVWFKLQPRWAKKPFFSELRADLIRKVAQAP